MARPVSASTASIASLAAIPYMIGDTASGSCASVSFQGALDSTIEHPTLACSRLNISENNTALVRDRFYVSYRHFHNVSKTDVFELQNDLNVDRVMFGIEKTYFDDTTSLELRVPVSRELSSNFAIILDDANTDRNTLPLRDREAEFGNVSFILKRILCRSSNWVISTGLAVQLPTADDVIARGDLDALFNIVDMPAPGFPLLDAFVDLEFNILVRNETINMSPFLAWAWVPDCGPASGRCFHQGFLQIDVPLNPSDASGRFDGTIDPTLIPGGALPQIGVNVNGEGKLYQQTLLRLNLNGGYRVYENPMARCLKSFTAMAELHYTTTLNDAKLVELPLFSYDYLGTPLPVDLQLGNGANRMDIINTAVGGSVQLGEHLTITNGFIMPVSKGTNKAFDAEYNLQMQCEY